MALYDAILESPLLSFLILSTGLVLSRCLYHLTLHPLSHIPGPLLGRVTSLWLYYHAYIGDEATVVHKAHKQYGPYVRVAPNEVDISDADAITPIYVSKGGFLKAPCYANFDIDGHKTIFSTTDNVYRAKRAKAIVPMFSTKSIRENQPALYGCADRMVDKMEEQARTGNPVNILNIARSLAVDAVSTHLFQSNYNGTSEKGSRLSISAFVDAFVAVGRFFYLPTDVFKWLEWAIERCMPNEHTAMSMKVVDKFVANLVDETPLGSMTYPGRLLPIIDRSEVQAQCKDLLFAGTDSTGMNFSIMCCELARHPEKYEILYKEVLDNANAGDQRQDIQALPYLSAVIKESLRISMANPTRLPHIVPEGGWTFKGTRFPARSFVGISAYELHFNEKVFPEAFNFQPERWLEENSEAAKSFFAFGAGSRACIARNLATFELYMAAERLVERDVLRGAKACQDKVEIYEWFNSSVKGEKIELIWEHFNA